MTQQPPLPPGPPPSQNGPGGQDTFGEAKGFLGSLFDFSFSHFITPKIVKFAYVLSTVLLGLAVLTYLVAGIVSGEPLVIIAALVIGPVLALLYLILIRMTLEFFVAVIRMSEDVHHRLPRA